ncbi:MAG: outer membrane lipoprotein-sorting protein [Prevotellaceae bacterium]|nr:outer membrane lipoprotein-sorting protein [Prevotellaceae bacterium]
MLKHILPMLLLPAAATGAHAQALSAAEIVKKADDNRRGKSSYSEIVMTVVRPTWQREVGVKSWSKGEKFGLTLITSPAKDKGQAFLKRDKDLWSWMPSIGRMIKMSSSVMGQSWMGSDFTNDDMVRQSSIVNDFDHTLNGEEVVNGTLCYKITLIPHEGTAVVWGKIMLWVSKVDFIEMKIENYDEENVLVNTMLGYDVKLFGKHKLATRMEMIPADKPNQKTVMTITKCDFETTIDDNFFSQQNMKKLAHNF